MSRAADTGDDTVRCTTCYKGVAGGQAGTFLRFTTPPIMSCHTAVSCGDADGKLTTVRPHDLPVAEDCWIVGPRKKVVRPPIPQFVFRPVFS